MEEQQHLGTAQRVLIRLEVVPADEKYPDIAEVDEIGRNIVNQLRKNGYTVEPLYTGGKGGSVFNIVIQVFNFIHEHEGLLTSVFASVSSALQIILRELDRGAEKGKAQRDLFEITLYVNGKPLKILAPDAESALELAKKFRSTYPEEAKRATSQNSISIQMRVPKKKRRRRD